MELTELLKEIDVHVFNDSPGFAAMAEAMHARRDEFATAMRLLRPTDLIQELRSVHQPLGQTAADETCSECGQAWPCRTERVLGQTRWLSTVAPAPQLRVVVCTWDLRHEVHEGVHVGINGSGQLAIGDMVYDNDNYIAVEIEPA